MTRRQLLEMAAVGGGIAAMAPAAAAPFTLPKLPYAYDALEPYIDARTMEIHHDKHHQAYVDNLNKIVANEPALAPLTVEQLLQKIDSLPGPLRAPLRNQGGGHANHSLFWETLAPSGKSGKPAAKLSTAIDKAFGGFTPFQDKLRATALAVFGSGWAWLSVLPGGELAIEPLPNQDSPILAGKQPLLGIDVWEHAYYLKYQNRRADYLTAVLQVINWDYVSHRYEEVSQ